MCISSDSVVISLQKSHFRAPLCSIFTWIVSSSIVLKHLWQWTQGLQCCLRFKFEFSNSIWGILDSLALFPSSVDFLLLSTWKKEMKNYLVIFLGAKILFLKNEKNSGQEFLKKNQEQKRAQWPKMRKKVLFGRTIHCLPQRLKSKVFVIFSSGGSPKGTRSEENFSKNIDFSLWVNHAST